MKESKSTAEAGLSFKDVEEILRIVEEFHAQEIRFEHRDLKLHIRRAAAEGAPPSSRAPTIASAPAAGPIAEASTNAPAAAPAASAAPASDAQSAPVPPGIEVVRAPMAGTFYKAPAPGAEPFVMPGAAVQAGADLCIIEVMKVMNRLKAPCAGMVVKVLVGDATAIAAGQGLMWIEPAGAKA